MRDFKTVETKYKGVYYMYDISDSIGEFWMLWDDYINGTVMQFNAKNKRIDECFDEFFKLRNEYNLNYQNQ